MLGPFECFVWLLCTLLEAGVVVCAVRTRSFRRYFLLNVYMGLSFLVSVGRYTVLRHSGVDSLEYAFQPRRSSEAVEPQPIHSRA